MELADDISSSSAATSQAVGRTPPGRPASTHSAQARALRVLRARPGRGARPHVPRPKPSCPSKRSTAGARARSSRGSSRTGRATRDPCSARARSPRRRSVPLPSAPRGFAGGCGRRGGDVRCIAWQPERGARRSLSPRAVPSTCTTGSRTTAGATGCRSRSCRRAAAGARRVKIRRLELVVLACGGCLRASCSSSRSARDGARDLRARGRRRRARVFGARRAARRRRCWTASTSPRSVSGKPLMHIKADRTIGYGPGAGLPPNLYAGEKVTLTVYPDDGAPVTVHSDRGDVRRAHAARRS